MGTDARYLTAHEAAEVLGVTLPTLYAYKSRGRLQSEPAPGRTRARRYLREDIERLLERKETRRDPAKAAARGLHWGSPVLASALTLIQDGRLYYRGHDAIELARHATLEEAAALLWSAEKHEAKTAFAQSCILPAPQLSVVRACSKDPVVRMQTALPLACAVDLAGYDLRPAAVRHTGARILRLFAAVLSGRDSHTPVHEVLHTAWAPRRPEVAEIIRMALVLCADHELNVSAFTARCAASAGATPYDAVSAALAALKGSRHGGETGRVAALLDEIGTPRRAPSVLAGRLRRGDRLPGFGHPLYPAGDPRAALLMQMCAAGSNRPAVKLARAVCRSAARLLHESPNVDFALVALGRAYDLPGYAPIVLFALGRTAGWIAHIIEQYQSAELIRPRASYTGPPPAEAASGRPAQ